MADSGTIARIDGIFKTVYGPAIVEQQNKTPDIATRYGKADNAFIRSLGGNHFEFSTRIGGNRAGIAPGASDDPLPVAGRQQEKKFTVTDRGIYGVIKMYEKDMLDAESNIESFISHKQDEMTGIVEDMLKVKNIDLSAGDGSGILATINAGTASATQTLAVGTSFGQFGSRYLQQNDVIDIYDSTLTTSRTSGAGVSVNTITRSSGGGAASVVLSASVTTTTGDIVVRGAGKVNKSYQGLYYMLRNQGVTFQGLSTTTYPILQANRINASGNALSDAYLQQAVTVVNVVSGKDFDEFAASHAQFDAYETLSIAQKRFTETTMDRGFETMTYKGKKFFKGVDIPPSVIYCLTRDSVKFGEVASLGFSEVDGSVLKWVAGYAAYTGFVREIGNMVYTRPNQNAIIDNLSYNTSSAAYAM